MKILKGDIRAAVGKKIINIDGAEFDLGKVSFQRKLDYRSILTNAIGKRKVDDVSADDLKKIQDDYLNWFTDEILNHNPNLDREIIQEYVLDNLQKLTEESNIAFKMATREDIEKHKKK